MNQPLRLALVISMLTLSSAAARGQRTIIQAGRLIDVRTGEVVPNATIVVERGRIVSTDKAVTPTARDTVVDLVEYTVLPGLIDAHVHLTIGGQPRDNALADLRAGFTTVVDLGARGTQLLQIRDSINAGHLPGPRVLAAGIWIGRKNGVCEFGGIGIAGDVDAFRARVRENVAAGANLIKACVSGWPAAAYAKPDEYEMPDSVLNAIVEESRRLRRKVIAHDISAGGVRAGLRAGVDGLAHAAYVDAAMARQMRANGMFVIPTLASLVGDDTSAASRDLVESVRRMHNAGVTLVFGTDGGVLPHGQNAREFLALARAGVQPLQAIRAATINSASALGMADSVGVLEPGMIADLIAIEGDPLVDLTALQRVRVVIQRGRVAPMKPGTPD